MLSQGHSFADAIQVEELISEPDIKYGQKWKATITGEELLNMKFPTILRKGSVKMIYGLPGILINQEDVPTLMHVPPVVLIREAIKKLNKANLKVQGPHTHHRSTILRSVQ